MKSLFLCVFVVAVSATVFKFPKACTPLEQQLQSIIALIPFPELSAIVAGYRENKDVEVTELVNFIQSGKLQEVVFQIYIMPEVQTQVQQLYTKGIHVLDTYLFVKETVMKKIPKSHKIIKAQSKGIVGLWNQMVAVLPVPDLTAAVLQLVMMNDEMHVIIEQLQSRAASEAARKVFERKDVVEDLNRLREAGIDVDGLEDFVVGMFEMSL